MADFIAVKVWDNLVRLTHWINAVTILLLLILGIIIHQSQVLGLGKASLELIIHIHAITGFIFAASLFARIAYMLSGPQGTSHWQDVIPHTKKQFALARRTLLYYIRGFRGKCPLYFAHNPLAGMAYTLFFMLASVQVLTGAIMYLFDGSTPAYAHSAHEMTLPTQDTWPPDFLIGLHDAGAILIACFILAHLVALFIHDIHEKRGLASSMISGYKFFTKAELEALDIPLPENEKD
jgi:Ni/Fe-hydrogenase 1 B-type cytochrome subunit